MMEGEGCSPEKNLNLQGINGRSQMKSGFSGERVYQCSRLLASARVCDLTHFW
jgi:hypothetical protein